MQTDAPSVLAYEPAEQAVHDELPAPEYVPLPQTLQLVDPGNAYRPPAHERHWDKLLAPVVVELVPEGQDEQETAPLTA